jgi:hypothetical protein
MTEVRTFDTGATRDKEDGKLDFEAFLSPLVLQRYAEYMHTCRIQADGKLRDGDNWQKGIPLTAYMKSAWRHFMVVWTKHRLGGDPTQDLCALLFNTMGYLHELEKAKQSTEASAGYQHTLELKPHEMNFVLNPDGPPRPFATVKYAYNLAVREGAADEVIEELNRELQAAFEEELKGAG